MSSYENMEIETCFFKCSHPDTGDLHHREAECECTEKSFMLTELPITNLTLDFTGVTIRAQERGKNEVSVAREQRNDLKWH